MMNEKSVNLPYTYAILDGSNCCIACRTYSYEVPLDNYIPIPSLEDDYRGCYYSYDTDLWYEDAAFTIEATAVNEMYHG